MIGVLDRLFCVDPESDWAIHDVESVNGGEAHFRRYLHRVLEALQTTTNAACAYVAISGLRAGRFTPCAAVGRPLEADLSISTHGGQSPLELCLANADPWCLLNSDAGSIGTSAFSPQRRQFLIKLVGHGELFGFICLEEEPNCPFNHLGLRELEKVIPLLNSKIAEENFSMRVGQIARPLAVSQRIDQSDGIYREIVEATSQAFASDGSVLRLYDSQLELLAVKDWTGEIDSDLLADKAPGEGICGRVLTHATHNWAMSMHGFGGSDVCLCVPPEDLDRLRRHGIESFIVMRLESHSSSLPGGDNIGTLSYFLRRPHRFSFRDVSLFRSFCQRVADAIALQRQNASLAEGYKSLRLQSTMMTRVEIVQLLAHDLFHKSFATAAAIEDYVAESTKATKAMTARPESRKQSSLEQLGIDAMEAARRLHATLHQLRALQVRGTEEFEKESTFDVCDIFSEIEDMLASALKSQKITIKRDPSIPLQLHGARNALVHIFFQLVINSIDAAKTRAKTRPMAIHIQGRIDVRRGEPHLIVQFWDEGPGIDRATFKDPNEIFLISRTTKPNGTGLGLAVARLLLTKYFDGHLTLVDPASALFRVDIPVRTE
jgi:signal transduction histidine kinase